MHEGISCTTVLLALGIISKGAIHKDYDINGAPMKFTVFFFFFVINGIDLEAVFNVKIEKLQI